MARLGVFGSGAVALILGVAAMQEPARQEPKGFRLGVVNMGTCFDKSKVERLKEVEVELQRLDDEHKKKLQDLQKKGTLIQEQLAGLGAASKLLREDKERQLVLLQTELKYEKEHGGARLMDRYRDINVEVYNEIRRVVSIIGQEQKYDLVLRIEAPLADDADADTSTSRISQRINNRVVLYHNESVDITPLVIQRLNEEYRKQKTAGDAGWECAKCKKTVKGDKCPVCGAAKK